MKCPQCERELISDPNPKYQYEAPFVAGKTHCEEHGYQPVPPAGHWNMNLGDGDGGGNGGSTGP